MDSRRFTYKNADSDPGYANNMIWHIHPPRASQPYHSKESIELMGGLINPEE